VDLSRRDVVKYGVLGSLGVVSLGDELQDRYEASEQVARATGLTDKREFALQQIRELENSYAKAARGEGGIADRVELLSPFLGNPNHFEGYRREGFVPDTQGLLEDRSPEEVFRHYAEEGIGEIPFTSTQASLLTDQELSIDLVYLNQGRDADELLSDGVEIVETEVGQVLPRDYGLAVDALSVEPREDVEAILDSVSESPNEALTGLNEEYGYDTGPTLPVYVFDPQEFDRLSAAAGLDFSKMWAGYGVPEGSLISLPSTLLRIEEDQFDEILVHEIGHSAFELPHSALQDDVMTYNTKAGNPTAFNGSSELLIRSYLNSDLEVREEKRNGERGIYFQQVSGEIPRSRAADAFFASVNAYITDIIDEFDLDVEKFEETDYQRRDGFDIAQYENYDGTGVDMEIIVDQLIHEIRSSVRS
jgi:hypothetical protein